MVSRGQKKNNKKRGTETERDSEREAAKESDRERATRSTRDHQQSSTSDRTRTASIHAGESEADERYARVARV